jgi:hypothetical protein
LLAVLWDTGRASEWPVLWDPVGSASQDQLPSLAAALDDFLDVNGLFEACIYERTRLLAPRRMYLEVWEEHARWWEFGWSWRVTDQRPQPGRFVDVVFSIPNSRVDRGDWRLACRAVVEAGLVEGSLGEQVEGGVDFHGRYVGLPQRRRTASPERRRRFEEARRARAEATGQWAEFKFGRTDTGLRKRPG